MADIVEDAAFSVFRGTDRHFLLTSAGTLAMDIDGERRTATSGRPVAFPGEADVSVRLVTGPTSVINLITNRAFCRGAIDVQQIHGPLVTDVNTAAIFLLDGTACLDDGQRMDPGNILIPGHKAPQVIAEDAVIASVLARRA